MKIRMLKALNQNKRCKCLAKETRSSLEKWLLSNLSVFKTEASSKLKCSSISRFKCRAKELATTTK